MAEQQKKPKFNDFYAYGVNTAFTALGEVQPLQIPIQADADFVLVKIMAESDDTAPVPLGGALIQIVDNGSQRRLFDRAEPLSSVAGTGQRPFILPWVHRFPRQGGISITLTNVGTATQEIRITLAGFKIIPIDRL